MDAPNLTLKPSEAPKGAQSKLFEPLSIANGKMTLKHRVVHAPLTRNRGVPLKESTPEDPNRIWVPDELVTEYYSQRTTDGGLLISEGIPPSLKSNGMPGVPGLFAPEHLKGWEKVVKAVHDKGGIFYAQLWHAGRTTVQQLTGSPTVSASVSPIEGDVYSHHPPPFSSTPVLYRDFPPEELSEQGIKDTIGEFVAAAKMALDAGFDGIEVHGGNGYLPEQFLNDNINKRTDAYGGTPEKRCRFPLELMTALAEAIGPEKCAIRLSPFGLFNQTRGTQRIETWSYLCRELKRTIPNLSYIHFIEPRFEQFHSYAEKDEFIKSWGLAPDSISLDLFREIMGDTPFFTAGGWNQDNSWGVIESGKYDAIAYGRHFLANPDFVERLKDGKPMNKYDRSRFYGPFPDDREVGYTDYPYSSDMESCAEAASQRVEI
ncbi:hypothetical protein AAFC00_002368 [Neodothiora populina]|uniref:NADH:flavin oxidoreductase/NADH oxidase N-terminal domain-containing protein n=1 Tax=Neodothiora populina TaxID=2781224 RepID=A0ABR3PH75_9PEZI